MKVFRAKISPNTSFATALHSDSLFGALCWVIQKNEGTDSLKDFLVPFIYGEPPLVLSNGFPGDLLPKPMIPFSIGDEEYDQSGKDQLIQMAAEGKRIKKVEYLNLDELNNVLCGRRDVISSKPKPYVDMAVMHNRINRWSGNTSEGGELFSTVERFSDVDHWSIYIKAKDEWAEKVEKWLEILGEMGFGKRKSVGKGSFTLVDFEAFDDFELPQSPNAFVTMSNFIPSSKDPVKGFYKTFVKYGKLDGEYAIEGVPFKKPLLMLIPGSVFKTDAVKEYYGRMVTGVSANYPEVVHYGYAFVIPAHIASA
jgi:CRISPR-associated protein Csm4